MIEEEDFEDVNPGEERVPILEEEGFYPAKCISLIWRRYSWGLKLIVLWEVFLSSDYSRRVMLRGFYNAQRDKRGKLKFGHHHAYRQDWIAANGGLPEEPRQLPFKIFKDGYFIVEVVTVRNSQRGAMHQLSWYSRVKRVIRRIDPNESFPEIPIELSEIFKRKAH